MGLGELLDSAVDLLVRSGVRRSKELAEAVEDCCGAEGNGGSGGGDCEVLIGWLAC